MIFIEFADYTRLGNWMFQYAAAISHDNDVRVKLACPYAVRKFPCYAEIFKGANIVADIPPDCQVYEEPAFAYRPLPDTSLEEWFVKGFFQSSRYLDDKKVRAVFEPCENRVQNIMTKYGEWLKRPNVCGVHVRRGDYLTLLHSHPFVGERFFRKAIAKLADSDDFIVCSDDIGWCKSFFAKTFPQKRFLFIEGTDEINDLYLLSLCSHNIISNGTFGWWTGWLNANKNKRVLAPSLWFGFVFKRLGYDWSDLYYEGVEVIDNNYTPLMYIKALGQYYWMKFKHFVFPLVKYMRGILRRR